MRNENKKNGKLGEKRREEKGCTFFVWEFKQRKEKKRNNALLFGSWKVG